MIRVEDVELVVPFYRDGLGLAVHKTYPNRLTQFWLPGGTILEVGYGGDRLSIPADRSKSPATLIFEVDAIEPMIERLTAHGGTVVNPPFESPAGGRFAYLADPEGHLIGLTTGVAALVERAYAQHDNP